jgi:ABC-type phosphate transport system substrate-binding protein
MKKAVSFLILSLIFFLSPNHTISKSPPALELAVIVHKDNPIEKLSITEVRLYWMKRGTQKSWPGLKTTVLPVDRKGNVAEKTLFYKHIIKLSEAEVDSYFAAKQYQNSEPPPVKLNSDNEVIEYVANNKGAIAFVKASLLTDEIRSRVKLVTSISE